MNRKQKLLTVVLALSLGVMTGALRSANAWISCEDIGCRGSAACDFGDPNGCNIDCSDGAVIYCRSDA